MLFAIISSETPLPSYEEWKKANPIEWKPDPKAFAKWEKGSSIEAKEAVWFDTGRVIEKRSKAGLTRGERGKGARIVGQPEIESLTDQLKKQHSGVVASVGFFVVPK